MSNATTRLHIIRAAVESMVFQTRDVVEAARAEATEGAMIAAMREVFGTYVQTLVSR